MDVCSTHVARLRRQGLSWRMALQHAGASYLDVRRALRDAESPLHDEDDDNEVDEERRTLGELREEITRAGGLDRWWAM